MWSNSHLKRSYIFSVGSPLLGLIASTYASAATIWVNPGGTKGCQLSIQAAAPADRRHAPRSFHPVAA
jgi:hypothetical protein